MPIEFRDAARFATHVIRRAPSDCWPWQAGLSATGYGKFWLRGRTVGAHRVAYELEKGPIPRPLSIDHLCRNRACVNPRHLEAVPIRTNILRGDGPAARNARRSHCKNGHRFTEDNTYRNPRGMRSCRTCQRQHIRDWECKNREKRVGQRRAWHANNLAARRAKDRVSKAAQRATPEGRAAYRTYMRDYCRRRRHRAGARSLSDGD